MESDEWGFLGPPADAPNEGQLQYMKTQAHIPDEVGSFVAEGSGYRYFVYVNDNLNDDLYNVTEVWLTGYRSCDMTGALSPNNLYNPPNSLVCQSATL